MSITFIIRRQGISDTININLSEISCGELHKQIAKKLKMRQQDIKLLNMIGTPYHPSQLIHNGTTVLIEKANHIQINKIVSAQQLDAMTQKAKFFMIKSSNDQNIQKARQHSVWATTFSNQEKLKNAFAYSEHVFLIFATNRSYQLKGLARMQGQPSKLADKGIWSGVSNIRLGGNFKIRWVRKKPLNCLQIEKVLGMNVKDQIMRLCDGQQADSTICRKLVKLFQIPNQHDIVIMQEQKQVQPKITALGQILGQKMLGFGIPTNVPIPQFIPQQIHQMAAMMARQIQFQEDQKKSKLKKKNRSNSSSDSQSDSEQSDRSRKKRKHKSKSKKDKKKKQKDSKKKQKHQKHKSKQKKHKHRKD